MAGVHPKAVQVVMRHCTITLTMDVYGHLFPDQQADAVGKLQDMLTSLDGQKPDSLRATGTDDSAEKARFGLDEARQTQRVAQRAGHEPTLPMISPCDLREEEKVTPAWATARRNVLPVEDLERDVPRGANDRDSSRGGDRTRTSLTGHRILNPVRLPFRHPAGTVSN